MRHLRATLIIFAAFLLSIIGTALELKYLGLKSSPFFSKVAVFVFINLNIIALLTLIFFVSRSLIKLYLERKRRLLGSRFKTKLVVIFVGLTLIPSILLFSLSNRVITNAVDRWFSLQVQRPIKDSMDVAKAFYERERENTLHLAMEYAKNRGAVVSPYKVMIIKSLPHNADDLIKEGFKGKADTEVSSNESGDIIRAVAPVVSNARVSGIVVVESSFPKEIVGKMKAVSQAYEDYKQLEALKVPIKRLYLLIPSLFSSLIMFLALWVSLHIAKGITVPIQGLAEATEEVARGNLDFSIDIKRQDEIGMLIDSFNSMIRQLKENKASLESAYMESDRRRICMESIIENTATGVISLDNAGNILTINRAACNILDLDQESLRNKGYREILERIQSEELREMVRKIGEKDFRGIERQIHVNIADRVAILRIYLSALRDSMGNPLGVLAVFDDLTEVIKAQRALAWQEIARRMAHEIKNPLTPIKLSAERLAKRWEAINSGKEAEDFGSILKQATNTIIKEVDGLRNLVNEFSRFGKMPEVNLMPIDIRTVVDEVVELYKNFKDVSIITDLKEVPPVDADREHLKRALINLIDNAIEANDKKGRLWIDVSYEPTIGMVKLEVADEGIGIKPEDKERLFLPYFSTKKGGTGLGLAIVSRIIAEHRGYIRVKDNEPKGTRFIIELPETVKSGK